jgi:dephospho-CoA kinase
MAMSEGQIRVLRVGLTGGIASGKSEVSKRLGGHGAFIIDGDLGARAVVEPGTPGLAQVAETFGSGVIRADGTLDRPKLGEIVFNDPESLAKLNAILHPLIWAWMDDQDLAARAAAGDDGVIIVVDNPLLIEMHRTHTVELVIVVDIPVETQVERLISSRGMTEEQARARIAAQTSRDERLAVASIVIETAGTLEDQDRRVAEVWADLQQRLAQAEPISRTAPSPLSS